MHILMIFLDGVGLGADDPVHNPLAAAHLPTLSALANGQRWLASTGRQESERATFIPTDPRLGVPGRPQSATGQAAILTGLNVPQLIGEHYGPKPDDRVRQYLDEASFFKQVRDRGGQAALLDAYPPALHHDIARGKTLRSSIQQAAYAGGQALMTLDDLKAGRALTPEWTGQAWRTYLKLNDTPVYTPLEAGRLLVAISREYDFAMHSHWMTDHVGHRGPLARGVEILEAFDGVMAGVLDAWDDDEGVVILTSDHGNLEDLSSRNHTENDIPTVLIGHARTGIADSIRSLVDYVPAMRMLLGLV
jgi:hypothetical protein